MALTCGACKSDLVETGVGSRSKCLACGAWVDQNDRSETVGGLVWTSDVPDQTEETARRTLDAAG